MISLAGSSGIAVYTYAHCHREWQFLLLAMWKLLLSCNLGAAYISRACSDRVHSDTPYEKTQADPPMTSMMISVPATIIGLTGLISLILRSWNDHRLRIVTGVFGTAAISCTILHLWYRLEWDDFLFSWDNYYDAHVWFVIW
jgi:hypothetical protein